MNAFFEQRAELIEGFLASLSEASFEATINRLESEKFLYSRGSMPLDPATQVIGATLKFVKPQGDQAGYYASLIHAALSVYQAAQERGLDSLVTLFTSQGPSPSRSTVSSPAARPVRSWCWSRGAASS